MPRAAPKRAYKIARPLKEGLEIPDSHSKGWIVGDIIGQGGFGCLYAGKFVNALKVALPCISSINCGSFVLI